MKHNFPENPNPHNPLTFHYRYNIMIFDISSGYTLTEQIKATLRIENLFDKKYYEIKGYRSKGRSLYFGLRYTL